MTNQTLLTNGLKYSAVQQAYYSPVAQVQGSKLTSMYCFLSRVDPWDDDNSPPIPTQDPKSLKLIMKSMFVAKHITANEISPVILRKDWTSTTIYDYYRDDIDINVLDQNSLPVYTYYVKNKYDQVFKCLWNNNGGLSTNEPYFEPGSYNTNNIFTGSDGYKWKYIYTIDTASKFNFMDSTWMPIPVSDYSANPTLFSAGYGNIDVINVMSAGSGYDQANSVINVTITGDGTGASGIAVVSDGSIASITVTSTGSNYTYANVSITSTQGQGATAIAPISPIGGHGSDPLSELGCSHIMITSTFNGSEQDSSGIDMIPTNIDYHQLGLLINPTSVDNQPEIADKEIYKTTTDLILAAGFGVFSPDETIYQGTSLSSATFVGTVLSFDSASNILKLINTTGCLTTNAPIFGVSSTTVRTLLSYSSPDFIALSGYIGYIENRSSIQRSSDGIEQFKIVLGY